MKNFPKQISLKEMKKNMHRYKNGIFLSKGNIKFLIGFIGRQGHRDTLFYEK
jgi:hypothetical protein